MFKFGYIYDMSIQISILEYLKLNKEFLAECFPDSAHMQHVFKIVVRVVWAFCEIETTSSHSHEGGRILLNRCSEICEIRYENTCVRYQPILVSKYEMWDMDMTPAL